MDYPRALDSSPEDRGLGVQDCVQTKTIERDWHWTSISAIFGFTFSNQVLTPDIYGAHWHKPIPR